MSKFFRKFEINNVGKDIGYANNEIHHHLQSEKYGDKYIRVIERRLGKHHNFTNKVSGSVEFFPKRHIYHVNKKHVYKHTDPQI